MTDRETPDTPGPSPEPADNPSWKVHEQGGQESLNRVRERYERYVKGQIGYEELQREAEEERAAAEGDEEAATEPSDKAEASDGAESSKPAESDDASQQAEAAAEDLSDSSRRID